jgi:hypothetical protein
MSKTLLECTANHDLTHYTTYYYLRLSLRSTYH